MLGEAAARAVEDLLASLGSALGRELRHREDSTLQNRTDVLYYLAYGDTRVDASEAQRRERARARGDDLGARHADDLPRAAVVRARHDGLARKDEPRPRGRDPADGDPRDPERRRRPAARLAHDDAGRRLRASADPRVDPAPVCGRTCSASACCSGSSRCSAASCRRTSRRSGRSCRSSSGRTRRACRRRTARSREEPPSRRSSGLRWPVSSSPSSARRTCCTSMRRHISSPSCSSWCSYRGVSPWWRLPSTGSWPGFASSFKTSSSPRWPRRSSCSAS